MMSLTGINDALRELGEGVKDDQLKGVVPGPARGRPPGHAHALPVRDQRRVAAAHGPAHLALAGQGPARRAGQALAARGKRL